MKNWESRDRVTNNKEVLKREEILHREIDPISPQIPFIHQIDEEYWSNDKLIVYRRNGAACLEMIYRYFDPNFELDQIAIHDQIEVIVEIEREIYDEEQLTLNIINDEYHETDVAHIVNDLNQNGFDVEVCQYASDPIQILHDCKQNYYKVINFNQIRDENEIYNYFTVFFDIDENFIYYFDPSEENGPSKLNIKNYLLKLSVLKEQIKKGENFITDYSDYDMKLGNTFIIIKGKNSND